MLEITFTRYVPASAHAAYDQIMNSEGVQADLLRRAENVARATGRDDAYCDVQPGRHRAHARASVPLAGYSNGENGFASRGHNRKAVDALQAAMSEARR